MAVHGKKAGLSLEDSSTTVRNLSPYLTSVSLPGAADSVEVSAFGSSEKTYVAGLRGKTLSFEGIFSSTPDGWLNGILGKEKNFVYYPYTTGAGTHYSGACILNAYEINSGIGAAVTFSGAAQVTGIVARSTS